MRKPRKTSSNAVKRPVKRSRKAAPRRGMCGLYNNTEHLAFSDGGLQVTYFWRGPRPY